MSHMTLKAARKAAKLTKVALAKKVGVDRATIARLEAGKTVPRLDTWEALEKALSRVLGEPVTLHRRAA